MEQMVAIAQVALLGAHPLLPLVRGRVGEASHPGPFHPETLAQYRRQEAQLQWELLVTQAKACSLWHLLVRMVPGWGGGSHDGGRQLASSCRSAGVDALGPRRLQWRHGG